MNYVEILRDVDILEGLSSEQLAQVAEIGEVKTYAGTEIIVKENTTSNELYIILQGMVEVLIDPSVLSAESAGRSGLKTIATLRRGECFGEVALVDQGLRSASVMCVQDETQVMVIPQKEFNDLCRGDFEMGYTVMRNIAADLAFKLRQTDIGMREQILWGRK